MRWPTRLTSRVSPEPAAASHRLRCWDQSAAIASSRHGAESSPFQAPIAIRRPRFARSVRQASHDVVVGKQEMVGAIDAVCDVAERIIGRLKESATAGGTPLRGDVVVNGAAAYPPTPAMKRFADSLSRKGIKPPPGYKTSISICRKFLSDHAPKKADGQAAGRLDPKPASPAQLLYATKIALGKGVVIPDEAKANSAAMAAWIDSNKGTKRRKSGRKTACKPAISISPQSTSPTKRSRKCKADAVEATPALPNLGTGTPLRIPYGNKEVAMKLGARYGSMGWYAPPGVDLSAFGERGWL